MANKKLETEEERSILVKRGSIFVLLKFSTYYVKYIKSIYQNYFVQIVIKILR